MAHLVLAQVQICPYTFVWIKPIPALRLVWKFLLVCFLSFFTNWASFPHFELFLQRLVNGAHGFQCQWHSSCFNSFLNLSPMAKWHSFLGEHSIKILLDMHSAYIVSTSLKPFFTKTSAQSLKSGPSCRKNQQQTFQKSFSSTLSQH